MLIATCIWYLWRREEANACKGIVCLPVIFCVSSHDLARGHGLAFHSFFQELLSFYEQMPSRDISMSMGRCKNKRTSPQGLPPPESHSTSHYRHNLPALYVTLPVSLLSLTACNLCARTLSWNASDSVHQRSTTNTTATQQKSQLQFEENINPTRIIHISTRFTAPDPKPLTPTLQVHLEKIHSASAHAQR